MNNMFKHIRPFLFILLTIVCSAVQAKNFWFKHIGLSEGLSSSQVNCICKDSRGFVWFGTTSGLDRYDGVSIREFQSNYAMSSALPDSYILSIQESYDGTLWIKTNGGYVIMDTHAQTFDRSASQRLSILSANLDPEVVFFDKRKNLWVYDKDKAIYHYKAKQQLVYTMPFEDSRVGLQPGTISGFCDARDGVLVAYTNGRVCCINGEQQKVLWSNDVIARNTNQEENYQVFTDTIGNIYLYSDAHSYIYDKQNKLWFQSLAEYIKHLELDAQLGNDIISGIDSDSHGYVWISTERNGVLLTDPIAGNVRQHVLSGGLRGLESNNIEACYVDDTDLLWVGTSNAGVSYFAPYLFMFDVDNLGNVYGIAEDKHCGLWFATHDRGLVYKNLRDGYTANYTSSDGLNDNMLSCVIAASDGTIWAGSNRFGLNRFNSSGIARYSAAPGSKSGLLDNNIQALVEDRFGNIWIATRNKGLQCLNTKTGKFSNFNVQNGKLLSDNVTCLATSGSELVAGTMNGVMAVNLSSNKVVQYTGTNSGDKHFTNNVITQVFIDSRGIIWVGTRDGLNMLDPSMDQLVTFSTVDGLPSNVICGIAEDKNHDIWVTTGKGISRIAIQNAANDQSRFAFNFYGYDVSDGLQGVEFNMGAILGTRNGKIYMGGQNGINWIRNLNKTPRKRLLKVMLSGLTIDDQPIEVGERYDGKVILSKVLNSVPSINVANSSQSICITLGIDDYNHAEHPRFIYQLEGANNAWLPVTGDGYTLKLNGLHSGTYTLHVKAMLDDGKTVSDEHSIVIKVEKQWWKRWWAHLFAVLLFAAFVYGIYRLWPYVIGYYRDRRREINELQQRQARIDNVAQDIRSKVVGMIPQLGILQIETKNPEHKETLNGLHHSAREMLNCLNQLKENQSMMVNDQGMDVGIDVGLVGDDMEGILIGDDGPTNSAGEGEFLVSDEGIITTSGVPVGSATYKHLIYIVEPDADMLEFVHDCLKNTYQLRTFTSSEDCWNAIAEQRPSLVMCAEGMSDVSGSTLCDRIKNERSYERIPFILTTEGTLTQAELLIKKITLMADDYIPSPYNLQSVIVRINRLIGVPLDNDIVMDDTLRGAEAMVKSANNQLRLMFDQYIMQNIGRKELSIEEMSAVMSTSRTQLFRKMEHVTGMSPSDYIRNMRLNEAAKLLESGFVSPAEASQELGFGNLASFSRFFQAKFGVLPSQYAEGERAAKQNK